MCKVDNIVLSNLTISPAVAPTKVTGRRRPRSVAFGGVEVRESIALCQNERNDIWYAQSDLEEFKQEARDLCRALRVQEYLDLPTGSMEETRGLEHRISLERQKHKFLANRAILKSQSRYESPEDLAVVAGKCSAWARQVALATGHKDFYAAYHPSLIDMMPEIPIAPFPLITRKRQSSRSLGEAAEELARNVRARPAADTPVQRALVTVP